MRTRLIPLVDLAHFVFGCVCKPRETAMPASPPIGPRSSTGAACFAFALRASAAAAAAMPARGADAAAEPVALLGSSLVRLMQSGGSPFAQRFAQFVPVVDQTFDLQVILRNSVGTRWDTMSAAEEADLMKAFRQYTGARFVASFDKYNGQQFRSTGTRDVPGGDKVVKTRIGDT